MTGLMRTQMKRNHKLKISRMPGLTRLRCEPCNFYAALIDGATKAETERLVKQAADEHLNPIKYQPLPEALARVFTGGFSELREKCTCSADQNDPLAFSLAEQEQRRKRCPVHGSTTGGDENER
jgi:hypothetical protein